MTRALAWPVVLLILLGVVFRQPLAKLIGRIKGFKTPAGEVEFIQEAEFRSYQGIIEERLEKTEDPEERRRLSTLLTIKRATLRLLGTLVAVGDVQRLGLTKYPEPKFQEAKRELVQFRLARLDRRRWYRPTEEGIESFRLHVETLLEKLRQG